MPHFDTLAREALESQMRRARTLPEIRSAKTVLRAWRQRYPDDFNILEGGEQLSLMEDIALEMAVNPEAFISPERQRVTLQAMDARTQPAIQAARQVLQEWAARNPDEAHQDDLNDGLLELLEVVEEHCVAKTRELQTIG